MKPGKSKANDLQRQRKEAMKMMLLAIIAVIGAIFFILILPAIFIVSKMKD